MTFLLQPPLHNHNSIRFTSIPSASNSPPSSLKFQVLPLISSLCSVCNSLKNFESLFRSYNEVGILIGYVNCSFFAFGFDRNSNLEGTSLLVSLTHNSIQFNSIKRIVRYKRSSSSCYELQVYLCIQWRYCLIADDMIHFSWRRKTLVENFAA